MDVNYNYGYDPTLFTGYGLQGGGGIPVASGIPSSGISASTGSTVNVGTGNLGPTADVGGSNPRTFTIFKVIIIVVLIILIIVSIVLAITFRNNTIQAQSNENPNGCPILSCPVGNPAFPLILSDQTCGTSAFRFNSAGQKICSSTRYASIADQGKQ